MATLEERLSNLVHWREASKNLGSYDNYANEAFWRQAIIDANDTAFVTQLEVQEIEIQNEEDFQKGVTEKEERMRIGNKIIATINYMNEVNNITQPQLVNILMDIDINAMMQALQTGSLNTAKILINAKDVSQLPPMNDSYKTRINKIIEDYFAN